MAWNEPYVQVGTTTITTPEFIVTTPQRYHIGLGDLIVYLNGLYAVKGIDYDEITPYSIKFREKLMKDDTIVFHYQKMW